MASKKRRTGPPQAGPGKYSRTGLSLLDLIRMFPDNHAAEDWFTEARWPAGVSSQPLFPNRAKQDSRSAPGTDAGRRQRGARPTAGG